MLVSASIIEAVAAKAVQHSFRNLVVDTVMVAKSGDRLLREDAVAAMRERLLPLAHVLTPNIPEAEALIEGKLRDDDDIREAARELAAMGARNVVIKGGHREGKTATDVLFDGEAFPRVQRAAHRDDEHSRHRLHLRLSDRDVPGPRRISPGRSWTRKGVPDGGAAPGISAGKRSWAGAPLLEAVAERVIEGRRTCRRRGKRPST